MQGIIALFFLSVSLIFPTSIFAKTWYYPMDHYFERQTVKTFGTLINDDFYKGKEQLFPYNRFYGYHTGVDLETFADEQNKLVPVYAVGGGKVSYIGSLSGYGGVILERLDGENHTALYGHVKISSLLYKLGDHINGGQVLTYLGDAFSKETSKERKHLHFAIHKGVDLYFHGHEDSLGLLHAKWENPNDSATSLVPPKTSSSPPNIFERIVTALKTFLSRVWRQNL